MRVPTTAGRRWGVSPYDAVFLPLLGGVVVVTWVTLAIWSASPYGRYVGHDWTSLGLAAYMCAALPAGEILLPAFLYVLGWVLMSAAMMLPTTVPLLRVFGRLVGQRADAGRLLAIVVGGYLFVWLGFGIVAHLIGVVLVALVQHSLWLSFNGWAIGVSLLLAAGLFQFSRLKYLCLEACGAPLGFVLARWRGRRPALEALLLGIAHGVYADLVRHGNWQRRLDGGPGWSDGDRKEHAMGLAPGAATWRHAARMCWRRCRAQSAGMTCQCSNCRNVNNCFTSTSTFNYSVDPPS